MRKLTLAKKMAKALNEIAGDTFGAPIIKTPKDDKWPAITICWDGPFEWPLHASWGENIYNSEGLGCDFEMPELKKVVQLAKDNGYYFEPESGCQLCVAD